MGMMSDWWEAAPELAGSYLVRTGPDVDRLLDLPGEPPEKPKPAKHPAGQCLCGRFAKWAGDRHYYNGQFDCYSYDVLCSRCGIVTVECV
jgi:hypothetical protein